MQKARACPVKSPKKHLQLQHICCIVLNMGMTAKEVIKILKKNGWKLVRIKGSHHHFLKAGARRPVVVPVHGNTDLGKFADDILKEAGIDPKGIKQ